VAILTSHERQLRQQNLSRRLSAPTRLEAKTDQQLVANIQTQCDPERLNDAYQALNYNQQLIQFADSKAGNLIVINSLFVAAAQVQANASQMARISQSAYVSLAAIAVLFCLAVISSKGKFSSESTGPDTLFFGDILRRSSAHSYHNDLACCSTDQLIAHTTCRTYNLAQVAARKFRLYHFAQTITTVAACAWVASSLLRLL
jgi:hypothetical protein